METPEMRKAALRAKHVAAIAAHEAEITAIERNGGFDDVTKSAAIRDRRNLIAKLREWIWMMDEPSDGYQT